MILEEMYNGRFYPCETVVADSPEYKRALKACSDLMETLSERLSKEDYKTGRGTARAGVDSPVRGKRKPLQIWFFSWVTCPAGGPRTGAAGRK